MYTCAYIHIQLHISTHLIDTYMYTCAYIQNIYNYIHLLTGTVLGASKDVVDKENGTNDDRLLVFARFPPRPTRCVGGA
jgi:hypothetical protein